MKRTQLVIFIIIFSLWSFTYRDDKKVNQPNKIITENTCIGNLKYYQFDVLDSTIMNLTVSGFQNISSNIRNCETSSKKEMRELTGMKVFNYPDSCSTKPFTISIPRTFWTEIQSSTGNYDYTLRLVELNDKNTLITISYDMDNSHKASILENSAKKTNETSKITIEGKTIHVYRNWQNKYAGSIITKHGITVNYYTSSKDKVKYLQKCISTFLINE